MQNVDAIRQSNQISASTEKSFQSQMKLLASQIITPPKTIADLKFNKSIKEKMIKLAKQQEDMKLVTELQKELNNIQREINMSTSVF